MFQVPVVVQAFIAGITAGKQICDFFDDYPHSPCPASVMQGRVFYA